MRRRSSLIAALAVVGVASVAAGPIKYSYSPASIPAGANPFENIGWYVDPDYTDKVQESVDRIEKTKLTNDRDLENLATMAGETPTSIWLDSDSIAGSKLKKILKDARDMNEDRRDPGGPLTVSFYLYNLPGRDCKKARKKGEFEASADGLKQYMKWIDKIHNTLEDFRDIRVVAILEPDAMANMATSSNENTDPCGMTKAYYRQGLDYAMGQLTSLSNVAVYLDIGHANWVGSAEQMDSLTSELTQLSNVKKIRGFHTNRAQYIPLKYPSASANGPLGALAFTEALAPKFEAAGLPTKFLIDTSRNGVPLPLGTTWCNSQAAGMGMRPTDVTGHSKLIDAYVWSQAGESDCSGDQPLTVPQPPQGQWFHEFFVQLVKNARPRLDAGKPRFSVS